MLMRLIQEEFDYNNFTLHSYLRFPLCNFFILDLSSYTIFPEYQLG